MLIGRFLSSPPLLTQKHDALALLLRLCVAFQLPAREGVEHVAPRAGLRRVPLLQLGGHVAAGCLARRRAGIGKDRQFPLTCGRADIFLLHKQQGPHHREVAAEEGLAHAHAVHAGVARQVEEEGLHQVVGIVTEGQVCQPVLGAEVEQAAPAQPRATEARRTLAVLLRMGLQPVGGQLHMAGDALAGEPGQEHLMVVGIEARVEVQGHDLEGKGDDGLPDPQAPEQHEGVHAAGDGHAHAAAGPEHAGLVYGLAHLFDAVFLRERAFLPWHGYLLQA